MRRDHLYGQTLHRAFKRAVGEADTSVAGPCFRNLAVLVLADLKALTNRVYPSRRAHSLRTQLLDVLCRRVIYLSNDELGRRRPSGGRRVQ